MHSWMRVNQVSRKHIFFIISIRNRRSTLSYSLVMSIFRVMKFAFFDFCVFIWCNNSKATKILSEIVLLDWNVLCDLEIKFGRTFLSLLAITLAASLYMTLQRAMGQNSEATVGLFTLGIKVIKVWLMEGGIELEFRQFRIANETSSPIEG